MGRQHRHQAAPITSPTPNSEEAKKSARPEGGKTMAVYRALKRGTEDLPPHPQ